MDLEKFKQNQKTAYLADLYKKLEKEEAETIALSASDKSFSELASEELAGFKAQKEALQKQMEDILADEGGEEEFPNEIILEVRAGAGGDEAALFAEELSLMYEKYALRRGWGTRLLSESRAPLGGFKEAVFEFKGKDVYKDLRYESGVHRIQRVPATEKIGRVHTSTASVAILPLRKKTT